MRKILAGAVIGAMLVVAGAADAAPKLRRYKVVTADGGQSVVEGTRISVEGVYVLVWIGRRLDTAICAPKYVTELPAEPATPEPEPEPEPAPEGLPVPLDPRSSSAPTVAL